MNSVSESIYSGLVYVLGKQGADGRWVDFALPPGPPDIWVTAYVGYSLAHVARIASDEGLNESLSRASNWLIENMRADFGWGYNNKTETDADSTAHGILFLASLGKSVDYSSFSQLMDFQKEDGGFCTYIIRHGENSWGDSHPEITATALTALLNKLEPDHEVIRKGASFVLKNRGVDGLWPSFWTETFLYSTAANLRFLSRIGKRVDAASFNVARIQTRNCFELALAGECLMLIDYPEAKVLLESVASRIVSLQQPDGSWREAPIVRLTSTDSHTPWIDVNSGRLYVDWNRIFTTATVLRFLGQYKQLS